VRIGIDLEFKILKENIAIQRPSCCCVKIVVKAPSMLLTSKNLSATYRQRPGGGSKMPNPQLTLPHEFAFGNALILTHSPNGY